MSHDRRWDANIVFEITPYTYWNGCSIPNHQHPDLENIIRAFRETASSSEQEAYDGYLYFKKTGRLPK
jgi:hypothetical protein